MIHSMRLKNFRAFRQQSFNFSKLNIFIGANSTGKSSVISAINLIAQSVKQTEVSSGPITFNGPFDQLGTFIDVVHGNRTNTPVGIELGYSGQNNSYKFNIEFKYRKVRRELEVLDFSLLKDDKFLYEYTSRKDAFDVKLRHRSVESVIPTSRKRRPEFNTLIPFDPNVAYSSLGSAEKVSPGNPKEITFLRELDRDIRMARTYLRRTFEAFDTISPFRDPPQRTYLYTGETPSNIGRTGSNGVSLLVRREGTKADYLSKISEWLHVTGFAKSISLKTLTDRHFEICVEDLDGKFHNICDVGFGCSQVLPVLIGALNSLHNNRVAGRTNPIFVVQEPEIHLHPNAQASLGSFFVSLVKEAGQLFIETHSDALVLRIMRHIAEGHISPDDLSIFFFENDAGGKRVQQIFVNERTAFQPPWPGGFFPQRESEALGLARARGKTRPMSGQQLQFSYPESRK